MIIKKITTGFVIQEFDTDTQLFTSQEFFAGDDIDYEDESGNPVNSKDMESSDGSEPYLPFDMLQPEIVANFLGVTPYQALDGHFGYN